MHESKMSALRGEFLHASVYIATYAKYDSTGEGGAGINAGGSGPRKLEAQFAGLHNHTSHINKVWDPFCKRKWFGISK